MQVWSWAKQGRAYLPFDNSIHRQEVAKPCHRLFFMFKVLMISLGELCGCPCNALCNPSTWSPKLGPSHTEVNMRIHFACNDCWMHDNLREAEAAQEHWLYVVKLIRWAEDRLHLLPLYQPPATHIGWSTENIKNERWRKIKTEQTWNHKPLLQALSPQLEWRKGNWRKGTEP